MAVTPVQTLKSKQELQLCNLPKVNMDDPPRRRLVNVLDVADVHSNQFLIFRRRTRPLSFVDLQRIATASLNPS